MRMFLEIRAGQPDGRLQPSTILIAAGNNRRLHIQWRAIRAKEAQRADPLIRGSNLQTCGDHEPEAISGSPCFDAKA